MEKKILEILADVCGSDIVKENMDVDLFEEGLLDSLGVIEFLVELEEQLKISIDPVDMDRTKVNTPNKLISFIQNIRQE